MECVAQVQPVLELQKIPPYHAEVPCAQGMLASVHQATQIIGTCQHLRDKTCAQEVVLVKLVYV